MVKQNETFETSFGESKWRVDQIIRKLKKFFSVAKNKVFIFNRRVDLAQSNLNF